MNESLKSKIAEKLDAFDDEHGRQVLDYLEFLESKYNRSRRTPSTVQRLAEGIEDRLGGIRIGDVAAKGTAQVVDAASRVVAGLAAAGKAVAEELQPARPPEAGREEGKPAANSEPATPPPSGGGGTAGESGSGGA
jgi:hypothetical protein